MTRKITLAAPLAVLFFSSAVAQNNLPEKVKRIRENAEQGYAAAEGALGLAYALGEGVPQDYQEAFKWYRKAAEKGTNPAQEYLGMMYMDGLGIPQDDVRAHMWLNLAASKLSGEDRDNAREQHDSLAKKMSREEIAEAQRLAREWKPKGEETGE